jgi:tetratricopeptide (TPR) repeat protein
VSEETEGQDTGADAVAGCVVGVDSAAVAIALGGASREDAKTFLEKQGRLVDLQCEYLADKDRFELSHLRWRRFTEQMKGALQALTAMVGIAVAAAVGLMVWDAAHSSGLIIEPFAVPADMAAKGLTGQAVASQMLDKLTAMQNGTESARPPQSYTNNWGEDLKVEIPETGISIGEVQRFLRGWLGHDTHITGEVWRTSTGIAIIARATGSTGEAVTGTEDNLDGLVQKIAENVYRVTQPYRYANYLDRNTFRQGTELRFGEAENIYKRLIYDANPIERAWAWNGLGTLAWNAQGDAGKAVRYYRKAIAVWPEFFVAWTAISAQESNVLGHAEAALAAARIAARFSPTQNEAQISEQTGDYAAYFRLCLSGVERPNIGNVNNHDVYQNGGLFALAALHDGNGFRTWLQNMPPMEAQANITRGAFRKMAALIALKDWHGAAAFEPKAENIAVIYTPTWDINNFFSRLLRPFLALAEARMGDAAGAQALIGKSPLDCNLCLRVRAQIADAAGKPREADAWFARAVQDSPSVPFAYADWGQSLLARGKSDEAIKQFTLANQKGPHFADPLEMWGEALMATNQSHLALAKFAESEKYAPNWGRLHLKWGEALFYAGRRDEANAQLARASALDLTTSEKSELARMRHV